uniref:PDZ domain-containing protein n=1 Tax=Poecilia reticulata TaxID=8081 RepID=A0A3P9NBD0_POERE
MSRLSNGPASAGSCAVSPTRSADYERRPLLRPDQWLVASVPSGSAPDGAPAAVGPGGGEGRCSLGGVVIVTATCAAGLSRFCSQGRRIEPIVLTRPASGGLGFSVVGLNPAGSAGRGVFVKHIQPGGIADRDGRLQEQDQILVINGSALEPGRNHQAVLSLLQQPGETVELVLARERRRRRRRRRSDRSMDGWMDVRK